MKFPPSTKIWHPELSVLLDAKVGENCTIHAPVWIGNNVVIGDRCKIQAFAFLPDGVVLESDVFIGPHVCFTNDKHPPSDMWLWTRVDEGASIGANCTILPGITIGAHAIVGAGSVVTKSVPAGAMVYGNPARVVNYRAKKAA